MREHPWHPRFVSLFLYVLFFSAAGFVAPAGAPLHTVVYLTGCLLIGRYLWKYRSLIPEMNWSFHWLAVPIALFACWAWVKLGLWMGQLSPNWFGKPGDNLIEKQHAAGWVNFIVRTIGMSFLVPMVEEPVFRSALLRSFAAWHSVKVTAIHLLEDIPGYGDQFMRKPISKWADQYPHPLRDGFEKTPVGELTWTNLTLVSVIWCFVHMPRDWMGVIVCALLYAGLTWWTNRGPRKMGLGPVMWAHGLTNLVLCLYTVIWKDWRFL